MDTEITQHSHPRRRRRLGALLLLSLVSGSIGAGALSLAVFGDQFVSNGNTFSSGYITLTATPTGTAPATWIVKAAQMMPGDSTNGQVVLKNDGTSPLRYAMKSTWTDGTPAGLAAGLTLEIQPMKTSCAAFDGTDIYNAAAGSAAFGLAAQGPDTGDRTLAAGASETLCFKLALPKAATNTLKNLSTSAVFQFDAEQTINNP